ncbi:MAG: electron transfer flavoprotein subunit beta/FixA family protein [Candidatus Hydromicrobium sp.]|nr:electron transfer flavoprotein subunit beta/FixA family protein [Candidatus Hydromicrobium sp.]
MIRIKIVVCIKQVPGTTEIKIDPETNTLIREGIENIINPFDAYAIEEGVRIRERFNDGEVEVIALTMGPPQSREILKEAISVGVDSAILLSDRAFAGADTWATSTTLAKAINKIEDCRLIILGKQTLDGDTGQVGPELAQRLNIPFIGYASSILEINRNKMKVKRLMEDRYETFEINLPAAISVVKDINTPRVPSLRGKMKAKSAEIPVWDAKQLEADEDEVGLSGSYTQVVKIFTPKIKHEIKMIEGSTGEQVEQLYKELKELNVI